MSYAYRALFISDIHMSNSLPQAGAPGPDGVTDRLREQVGLWKVVKKKAKAFGASDIIILGDLFDKALVDPVTLNATVGAIVGLGMPVYILAGNHDERGGRFNTECFGMMQDRIHFLTQAGEPFMPRDWLAFHPFDYSGHVEAETAIEKAELGRGVNVALLHHSIRGCSHLGWVCDDGLDPEKLARFNYALSGHFHETQEFLGGRGMYLGSPMHHHYGDVGRLATAWCVEFREDGSWKREAFDPGLPKFHEIDWGDKLPFEPEDGAGEFLRVTVEATTAEFKGMKSELDTYVSGLKRAGVRIHVKHKPRYHHEARLSATSTVKKAKKSSPVDLIDSYVGSASVVTLGLDKDKLRALGREVYAEAAGEDRGRSAAGEMGALVRLEATDFCTFSALDLPLEKQGLVLLLGDNQDTTSAESNGAGKSNIFKAIAWGCYGETTDESKGDAVIRAGQRSTTVKIHYRGGWRSERTRNRGAPKLALFAPDGEPVKGSKDELQARIDELIGMDFSAFRNTALYAQKDHERFLSMDDRARKDMLHRMLRTTVYEVCHENVKERARKVGATLSEAKRAHEKHTADGERERATAEEMRSRSRSFKGEQRAEAIRLRDKAQGLLDEAGAVGAGEAELASLEERLAACGDVAEGEKAVDKRVSALNREIEAFNKECSDLRVAASKWDSRAEAYNETLERAGDERCPVCGGDVTEGSAAEHLAEVRANMEKAQAEAARCEVARKAMKKRGDALDAQQSALADEKRLAMRRTREASDLVRSIAVHKRDVAAAAERRKLLKKQAKDLIERAKAERDKADPYKELADKAAARASASDREAGKAAAIVFKAEESSKFLEFWVRGFSPTGLPSFVLDSTMPFLSERSNHYLEKLADGDITMEFSTQSELKSTKGEVRDKIGVNWVVEGVEGYPPSGGQWKKMEIATDLALMDLVAGQEGGHLGILMMDECLDGLDAGGKSRILLLLQELRSARPSIFVISHDPNVAEVFEKRIKVQKKAGVTSVQS